MLMVLQVQKAHSQRAYRQCKQLLLGVQYYLFIIMEVNPCFSFHKCSSYLHDNSFYCIGTAPPLNGFSKHGTLTKVARVTNKHDYLWKVSAELNILLSIELNIPLFLELAKKTMKWNWKRNKVGMFSLFLN